MGDELATVLRLVAEGKLSAAEAAPIIEALQRPAAPPAPEPPFPFGSAGPTGARGPGRGRRVRIQVSQRGRKVIDVRIPLAFAAMAAKMVPGIPDSYAKLIAEAVETDMVGPIVDAEDEDGGSVLISIE
jgi:hypothetical protein